MFFICRAIPYIDFANSYDSTKVELLYISKFLTEDGTHLVNWFIGPNLRELEQVRDMRITKYSLKSCHTLFMQHYATNYVIFIPQGLFAQSNISH